MLFRSLEREGVNTVFGYPGGAILPAYDALQHSSIRHILVRHEQGATHMADGYARASGRVGVVAAVNAVGAVRDPESGAWVAGRPPPADGALAPGEWRGQTTLVCVATDAGSAGSGSTGMLGSGGANAGTGASNSGAGSSAVNVAGGAGGNNSANHPGGGAGGGATDSANLIKNGDFSQGNAYWNFMPQGGANPSFGSGAYCVTSGSGGGASFGLGYPLDPADAFSIAAGTNYTLSYRAMGSGTVSVKIGGASAPYTELTSFNDTVSSPGSYVSESHWLMPGNGMDGVGLVFNVTLDSSQTICFDDVVLVKN